MALALALALPNSSSATGRYILKSNNYIESGEWRMEREEALSKFIENDASATRLQRATLNLILDAIAIA